jgi:hypothetical protein
MKNFQNLNRAIFDLRKRGYRLDFSFTSDHLICVPLHLKINLSDIEIDETYKFPSQEKPGKLNILCALKTLSGQRGILLDVSDRIFELFEVVRPKLGIDVSKQKSASKNNVTVSKNFSRTLK